MENKNQLSQLALFLILVGISLDYAFTLRFHIKHRKVIVVGGGSVS
jgi:hypothetical protein